MTRTSNRSYGAFAATGTVLCVLTFIAGSRLAEAKATFAQAAQELAEVQEAAAAIHERRRQPTSPQLEEVGESALPSVLRTAASSQGIGDTAIQSIKPMPARHLGSDGVAKLYTRRSTELALRGVTLRQVLQLLHDVKLQYPGVQVDSIYLTGPDGTGTATAWNVSPVVVSHLVYKPARGDGGREPGR